MSALAKADRLKSCLYLAKKIIEDRFKCYRKDLPRPVPPGLSKPKNAEQHQPFPGSGISVCFQHVLAEDG